MYAATPSPRKRRGSVGTNSGPGFLTDTVLGWKDDFADKPSALQPPSQVEPKKDWQAVHTPSPKERGDAANKHHSFSRAAVFAWGGCFTPPTYAPELPPQIMSPHRIATKTKLLKDLRAEIAKANAVAIDKELAILAELKAAAPNRTGTVMDKLPISLRVLGQNWRLITHDSCPHASEIIPGVFISSRPFAMIENRGSLIYDISPEAAKSEIKGILVLQNFVAEVKSPVCIISLCTDWELSDEAGKPVSWGGCTAVTGSVIFSADNKVVRIPVGVGLGDHGAYDPRTWLLIDFAEILRVVRLAKQHFDDGYKLLIHCFSGIERSTMTGIIFLMLHKHMSLAAASQLIRDKRSIAKGLLQFSESVQAILGRALVYALANDRVIWADFSHRFCKREAESQIHAELKMLQSLLPHVGHMSQAEIDSLGSDIAMIREKMKFSVQMSVHSIPVLKPLAEAVEDRQLALSAVVASAGSSTSETTVNLSL